MYSMSTFYGVYCIFIIFIRLIFPQAKEEGIILLILCIHFSCSYQTPKIYTICHLSAATAHTCCTVSIPTCYRRSTMACWRRTAAQRVTLPATADSANHQYYRISNYHRRFHHLNILAYHWIRWVLKSYHRGLLTMVELILVIEKLPIKHLQKFKIGVKQVAWLSKGIYSIFERIFLPFTPFIWEVTINPN